MGRKVRKVVGIEDESAGFDLTFICTISSLLAELQPWLKKKNMYHLFYINLHIKIIHANDCLRFHCKLLCISYCPEYLCTSQ